MTFVPEMSVRLLPAAIFTFFPTMLISPLGAMMLIPVKELMKMSPQGDLMETLRPSDEPLIEYMPYLSVSVKPPSKYLFPSHAESPFETLLEMDEGNQAATEL